MAEGEGTSDLGGMEIWEGWELGPRSVVVPTAAASTATRRIVRTGEHPSNFAELWHPSATAAAGAGLLPVAVLVHGNIPLLPRITHN